MESTLTPVRGAGGSDNNLDTSNGVAPIPAAGEAGVARPEGTAGNLRVLDWAGFQAAVSYTFDDANSSQIDNYVALQGAGVPLTFYILTGKSDARDPVWAQALLDGHELGNHSKSHLSGDSAGIAVDTDAATTFLHEQHGIAVWTMASPFGHTQYVDIAKQRFLLNRGVNAGTIQPNGSTNPFNLNCWTPSEGAEEAEFNEKVDAVRSAGNWQLVLLHGFTGGTDGAYKPVSLDGFVAGLEYAKSLGDVWIGTVAQVGAYWLAQRLFAGLSPEEVDGGQRWSWELPEDFPPGQSLRVTVDGGTLVQGDAVLAWDDHGYYEVALDAGSVTLLD
jgi:peptidoglycan/xylan/chitin deacetylase (PgdA/CDA1 family)